MEVQMRNEEKEITSLFLSVVDIVAAKRRIARDRSRMEHNCQRNNIDPRVMAYLENEYERSLDQEGYKMKTVHEIIALLKGNDNEEL